MKTQMKITAVILVTLVTCCGVFADYASTVEASNPVAYYRFSETSGTSAANEMSGGSAYNGTFAYGSVPSTATAAAPADYDIAGPSGVSFPGFEANNSSFRVNANTSVGDYLNMTTLGSLGSSISTNSGISVEMWIKTGQSWASPLLGTYNSTDSTGFNIDINKNVTTASQDYVTVFLRSANGRYLRGVAYTDSGDGGVTDNEWHHLVFVMNRLQSSVMIYMDGQSLDVTITSDLPFGSFTDFEYPMLLGATNLRDSTNVSGTDYYTGQMDEFAIYDTALSQSEVLAHYNAAVVPEPATCMLIFMGGSLIVIRKIHCK